MNAKKTSAAVLVGALSVAALAGCASLRGQDGAAQPAPQIQSQTELQDMARAEAAQLRLEIRNRERAINAASDRLQGLADAWQQRHSTLTPSQVGSYVADALRQDKQDASRFLTPSSVTQFVSPPSAVESMRLDKKNLRVPVADTVDDDLSPTAPRPEETPTPTPPGSSEQVRQVKQDESREGAE
ncbi:hypothetical protein ET445_04835 [Agromyces protaetiae]|uniref:Uncharacterized protein n=1 Tax=Agromyces protaetiae TaxID=2509455 RepID=A0A4P6FAD8_9MICO|nr:hypothetical protein [Agromyces protaetiae]QAY72764.1 hypothetical protein ET445_04835 [Agromyces protaetiae]